MQASIFQFGRCALLGAFAVLFALSASAQSPADGAGAGAAVDTHADRLEYNRETGVLRLIGNARVQRAAIDEMLRADRITLNEKTGEILAEGKVFYRQGERTWQGERLAYNMNEKKWTVPGEFAFQEGPIHIQGTAAEELDDGQYLVRGVRMTTCDPDDPYPEYRVQARKIVVRPGDRIKGYSSTIYMGRVPVFWTPYFFKDMDDAGWHFEPGLNSRHGAFLLSTYRARLNPALRSDSHIDVRAERGVAVGQDFAWTDPEEARWNGYLLTYYTDDQKPYEDNEIDDGLVEDQRYRARLWHNHTFSSRDYALVALHLVSDPDVLEDFFDKENRSTPVPENYASLTHRGDDYTANLLLQMRLNDFYGGVVRQPEASVAIPRREIVGTPFYYEGRTAATALERLYAEGSISEDYDAFRFDTDHTLLYPTRQAGFLSVIPRVGYRGTSYSKTRGSVRTTSVTPRSTTNVTVAADGTTNVSVLVSTSTNTTTQVVDGGAEFRSLFELGVETSFKMFKVLDDNPARPLRHIVEPYADYTIIPEPNVTPNQLFQFDSVDRLGEEHSVKIGVRNKLQTKQHDLPFDLVDVDVNTKYYIKELANGDQLGPLNLDAEFRTLQNLQIDVDAAYDVEDSELQTFNTQVHTRRDLPWRAWVEFRHRKDQNSLVSGRLGYQPNAEWEGGVYSRYEMETSELEEVAVDLTRTMDCLAWRLALGVIPSHIRTDGSERDDEVYGSLEFWVTAFPNTSIGGTASN